MGDKYIFREIKKEEKGGGNIFIKKAEKYALQKDKPEKEVKIWGGWKWVIPMRIGTWK